jgi:hypothetical protein
VSAALAEAAREGATPLAAAQQRFYAACRQADEALQLAETGDTETGPNGDSLVGWRDSLLEQNRALAKQNNFEDLRAEAERRADTVTAARSPGDESEPAALAGLGPARVRAPVPDYGTPCYLTAHDAMMLPALVLRPLAERHTRNALAGSAALLGLLAVAGTIALLPGVRRRLRPFWPEPLLLIGLLAWLWSGFTPAALFFLAAGVAARALELAAGVRRWFSKRSPAAALATATPPAGS